MLQGHNHTISLKGSKGDGKPVGYLVYPVPPRLPLLASISESALLLLITVAYDGGGDVRVDPEGGYAHIPQGPAAKQVKHPQELV